MKQYYVYLITNASYATIYIGVTSDLERRISEHRQQVHAGFSKKYNLTTLVYYETTGEAAAAIAREKQLKGWTRAKKIALIESMNPEWRDLSSDRGS